MEVQGVKAWHGPINAPISFAMDAISQPPIRTVGLPSVLMSPCFSISNASSSALDMEGRIRRWCTLNLSSISVVSIKSVLLTLIVSSSRAASLICSSHFGWIQSPVATRSIPFFEASEAIVGSSILSEHAIEYLECRCKSALIFMGLPYISQIFVSCSYFRYHLGLLLLLFILFQPCHYFFHLFCPLFKRPCIYFHIK